MEKERQCHLASGLPNYHLGQISYIQTCTAIGKSTAMPGRSARR